MPSRFETTFNSRVVPAAERSFGVTVYLSRGALVTDSFTARRHDEDHRSMGQEYGFDIREVMRAFVFPTSYLAFDGELTEPEISDKIIEVDSGEVYEVIPPAEGRPAFEPHMSGTEWKVYARRIEQGGE